MGEVRTSTGLQVGREHGRRHHVSRVHRRRSGTRATSRVTAGTSLVRDQRGTSLTAKQTNPAQTEVSQLKMAVLVNEQVVRLEITKSP